MRLELATQNDFDAIIAFYDDVTERTPEMATYAHPTELHTHEHNHLFIVIEGEARIQLGDETVIIHKDEAFLVEGRIPHSCWNNTDSVTKMIGITVI